MYQFTFGGVSYTLGKLTAGVKNAFVAWLKPRYLREAKELLDAAEYIVERQAVVAGSIFWTGTMSVHVATAVYSAEGERHLLRLLLGEQGAKIPDSTLEAMIAERDAENTPSEFREAWNLVWEEAEPKKLTATVETSTPTVTLPVNGDTPV